MLDNSLQSSVFALNDRKSKSLFEFRPMQKKEKETPNFYPLISEVVIAVS